MRRKLMTIGLGIFLFLGAFAITNYAFDEEADCAKDCGATNAAGCALVGCQYIRSNGTTIVQCLYKTTNCDGGGPSPDQPPGTP